MQFFQARRAAFGPRLKSVGLRIREPETWSVARISTSAKPSAGDVLLADGMVRKRPYAENAETVFLVMVDLTASLTALEKRKQISGSKPKSGSITAVTQVTQLRHFPIFVKI